MFDAGLWETYRSALPLLLKGSLVTVWISAIGIACGFTLGCIFGVLDCNKLRRPWLSPIIRSYVTIFRGTPLFVQLLIVYFALPDALGIELSPISAGIITLGLIRRRIWPKLFALASTLLIQVSGKRAIFWAIPLFRLFVM